jgi:hypothetical protein
MRCLNHQRVSKNCLGEAPWALAASDNGKDENPLSLGYLVVQLRSLAVDQHYNVTVK